MEEGWSRGYGGGRRVGGVIAWWALKFKAADGGVFVAVVCPVFFWVKLRECCLILGHFILRGDGFSGGFGGKLRLGGGEGEGFHCL